MAHFLDGCGLTWKILVRDRQPMNSSERRTRMRWGGYRSVVIASFAFDDLHYRDALPV